MDKATKHIVGDVSYVNEGLPMVEVFEVVINKIQNDKPYCDLHGKITVNSNSLSNDYIYKGDSCERIELGRSLLLTGPSNYISVLDGFSITVDLWDKNSGVFSSGKISIYPYQSYYCDHDRPLQKKISGEYGSATVRYIIWSDAVGATVSVTLICRDNESPAKIYGSLKALSGKFKSNEDLKMLSTSTLLNKTQDDLIVVQEAHWEIPLSRKVLAVSLDSSLIISVDLRLVFVDDLCNTTENFQGNLEVPAQRSGAHVEELIGNSGSKIQVNVTFAT